jgi:hypothetical protein
MRTESLAAAFGQQVQTTGVWNGARKAERVGSSRVQSFFPAYVPTQPGGGRSDKLPNVQNIGNRSTIVTAAVIRRRQAL